MTENERLLANIDSNITENEPARGISSDTLQKAPWVIPFERSSWKRTVRLVEDDDLEGRTGIARHSLVSHQRLRELLHLSRLK